MPVVSTQYDAYTGQVFVATADGTILWLDESFKPVGQANVGAGLSAIRLDDATGVLYVSYDNAVDGKPGLRLFETRNSMSKLAEYELDAGADALDVDTTTGIAYVGHTTGGLSVVDLVRRKVTSLDKGKSIAGVGVDPRRGMVYLASATKSPAPVIVVGRDQAPAIDDSPVSKIAVAGDTVTFDAAAHAFPAPTVSWEKRERNGKCVAIRHADGNVLKISATQDADGTQYRAVYRNVIDGKHYSTHSGSATLRVVPKRGHR
jgi:hypothetical protein